MKNRLLLVMLGAATGFAAAGRCADVPTNVWVGASGGAFETASNWSNPSLVTDGAAFFAVFTNETAGTDSPFDVTTSTTPFVYGISYAPPTRADDATNVLKLGSITCRRHEAFGNAARLDVGAGACLSIGAKIAAESSAPVEKVGAGTIQFGADEASFVSLRVSEGVVESTAKMALAGSEIATQGTGLFRLACDAVVRDVRLADGTSTRSVDLNGHALSLGGSSDARTASVDTFAGAGTLALQNGAALDVTAPQSADVDLVVRNADLGLKGRIFGCYTFNDPDAPWANATGHADLVPGANGAPTIQKDATRGYVAYFDGTTSLVGPGADGALDYMPQGASDYTVAFWMKTASDCKANGGILLWGAWGKNGACTYLRVRRDSSTGSAFLYTHYGVGLNVGVDDDQRRAFAALDGNWHHVAIRTVSGIGEFWVDGVCVQKSGTDFAADIQAGPFNLGYGQSGGFKGWIDDFTVVCAAVDPAALMKATQNGTSAYALLPRAPVVRYDGGGTLASDGGQPIAGLEGDGVTGTLDLLGDQALVGTGKARTFAWSGSITGAGDVVKKGANTRQVLAGPQKFAGDLRVEEGTLELRPLVATNIAASCVARWTFDDATAPGRDTSGTGFTLAAQGSGVSVVTDDERGSVLKLDATKKSYLASTGNAPAAFPTGSSSYTIMLWMRPTSGRTVQPYVWFMGEPESGRCDGLRLNGAKGLTFSNWGNDQTVATETNFHDGKWHHVAKVYDGTTAALYVDGEEVGRVAATPDIASAPFYLGRRRGDNVNVYFDGCLDDVRVYATALSADEIGFAFAGAKPEPLARWTFDDANAPYASTGTGGAFTLTASGAAAVSTSDDQRAGGVLDLSGDGAVSCLSAETIPTWMPASGSFTVAFWMRPKTGSGGNACFWFGGSGADAAGWLVAPRNDVSFRFARGSGTALDAASLPYCAGASNKWTHVTCTYDAAKTTMRIYFDGACVAERTDAADATFSRDRLFIGRAQDSDAGFSGWLDDVCVWAAALTPAQVRAQCAEGTGRLAEQLLSAQTGVLVADGATFALGSGADATAATLAGEGDVALASGSRLTLAVGGAFDGTLTGAGTLALAGGALTRTDGAAVKASVAIADGAAFATDATGAGLPAVTAEGAVTIPANGTLTFDCRRSAVGGRTFVIARGASVAAPDGLFGWKAVFTGADDNVDVRFAVKDNAFTATVAARGMVVVIR